MKKYERTMAEIDLEALEHNYHILRKRAGCALMAVVKADAYGHGANRVSRVLDRAVADWLAVATAEEARLLRVAHVQLPILVLGYVGPTHAKSMARNGIAITVTGPEHAAELSEAAVKGKFSIRAHFKLDTGMSRLGFSSVEELEAALALPGLEAEGLCSHLAVSDEPDNPFTELQETRFAEARERLERAGHTFKFIHCANSGRVVNCKGTVPGNLARAGIALYGCGPGTQMGLRPVMSLWAPVMLIREVKAGETVSYGRRWTAGRASRIAVLQYGYADGYHRALSGKGHVVLHGHQCPVVGTVCMDMLMADVTDVPEAEAGDRALVFGRERRRGDAIEVSLDELAEKAGTISYELLCAVSARVPRKYIG